MDSAGCGASSDAECGFSLKSAFVDDDLARRCSANFQAARALRVTTKATTSLASTGFHRRL